MADSTTPTPRYNPDEVPEVPAQLVTVPVMTDALLLSARLDALLGLYAIQAMIATAMGQASAALVRAHTIEYNLRKYFALQDRLSTTLDRSDAAQLAAQAETLLEILREQVAMGK